MLQVKAKSQHGHTNGSNCRKHPARVRIQPVQQNQATSSFSTNHRAFAPSGIVRWFGVASRDKFRAAQPYDADVMNCWNASHQITRPA